MGLAWTTKKRIDRLLFILVNDPAPILDHFLARVHRKWAIVRAMERVGLCILIACGLAAILAGVLMWREESALNVTVVCLGAGALVGLVVGWMTRPSLFDAAVEVDRQLNLADLLATAISIRRDQTVVSDSLDQQWSSTILALAEARCSTIANEALMLRRFGIRAWGGIGICTAVVLTLGALSSNPLVLQARSVGSTTDTATLPDARTTTQSNRVDQSATATPNAVEPTSSEHSRIDGNSDHASQTQSAPSDHTSSAANDQTGSGAGRTNDTSAQQPDLAGTSPATPASAGDLASGGGRTNTNGSAGTSASTPAADSRANQPAPPWTTSDWPAARPRASEQIRNGDVPDAYRDLVRDYFAR